MRVEIHCFTTVKLVKHVSRICYTIPMNLPLIVILGPTASGKTGYAIELAQRIDGEIICADSRTVYKGMDVGTAKPTKHEREIVLHWALDLVEPDQRFTLYDFQQYAYSKIAEIRGRGHVPMLVGGTGLYIDSVIYHYGLTKEIEFDTARRGKLEQMSVAELVNHATSRQIELPKDALNKRRLVRAIEQGGVNKKCTQLDDNTVVIGIETDMNKLSVRSRVRSEQMLADGLIDETKWLLTKYGSVEPLRRNAYGVVWKYLDGEITDTDELIDKMTITDRHLVKKQLTWWRSARRAGDIMWRTLDELNNQLRQFDELDGTELLTQIVSEYKKFQNNRANSEK